MSPEPRPPAVKRRAIYIFLVCSVLFGLGQFHRYSGAVVMLPVADDLSIAVESLGVAAAALFFASALVQVPTGMALDRFGPRIIIPSITILGVVGSLMLATATNFHEVLTSRILIGVGYSAIMMSSYVLFAKWFPPTKFATLASWLLAASSIGGMMASGPLAYIIEHYGWRAPFVVIAVITLLMLLIGVYIIRDVPPGYKYDRATPGTMGQSFRGYREVLLHPKFFNLLAMGFVAYGPAVAVLGMWGGPYLEGRYNLDGYERGQILLLMTIVVPVGALFFGPLDRYFSSRKKIVITAVLTELVAFSILGLVDNLPLWAVTCLFVYIAFVQQYYVVLGAHCRNSFPDHLVGRANSTLNLISITGVGFMQSLFGWVLAANGDSGYEHSFLIVAGLLVAALVIYAGSSEKPVTQPS
ncbi:MFS transporter [Sneathiella sp. CAU 1612]|jgi:MFS family permease|uniref:MFS transporter n=1 Tax=Sneathiella sedimenti TaxID=2816034 RepID=A0ABS3F809_9PROT|nr:MFS transporter [Sneathiella sedimenti]MBO0334241.1 MFS transporter [Sneathiella sedimenti]